MPRIQPSVVKEGSFVFKREGKWWLGEAPAIQGAYTQGHTLAEARYNLVSLIKELNVLARPDVEAKQIAAQARALLPGA